MTNAPLVIQPGIDSDDTSFSSKGRWNDGDKVRFWRGQPQTIGGWESFTSNLLTGVCRSILPFTDNTSALNVAFGTNSNLEVWVGGVLYDITPVTGFTPGAVDGTGGAGYGTGAYSVGAYSEPSTAAFYPLTWSLSNYGQSLMANPRGQTIFWWQNDTGTPAAPLANAPAEVTYTLVTPQRQVVAFGCSDALSGDFNALAIRGSDIEDPTDWMATPTNNAFEDVLQGAGRIVGARQIGDYLFIWTDNALYLGTFLGNPDQTFRFECIGLNCGLIGPNAAIVVGQTAYWLGADIQFRSCALGGAVQIIPCPILDDMRDNLVPSQSDKITAASITQYAEIRFDYPDTRDGLENSRYVAVNVLDGSWSKGMMKRSAFVDSGPALSPLGAMPDGNAYYHERGHSADGAAFSWFIESADQYIGEADQTLAVMGIWPDFHEQVGPVSVEVAVRLYPQATERVKGPFVLVPGRQKKDFRATGRVARIRISGNSSPTYCRVGKPEFDTVAEGQR